MSAEANLYAGTCIVVGAALIGYTIHQRNKIRDSQHWQAVPGTILKAAVVKNDTSDGVEYNLLVQYEYVVNGSRHVGQRIEFGQTRAYVRKKSAEAQLARYPVNCGVMVYCNPEHPEQAVLSRAASYTTLYFVIGVLSLALGLTIVVRSLLVG